MSLYSIFVFLHVTAALAMFAALGLEWGVIKGFSRATTVAQIHDSMRPLGAVRRLGGPAALVLLATGIYMGMSRWGGQPWIGLGFLGLLIIAGLGAGLSGRRLGALVRAVPPEDGPIPDALKPLLHDPRFRLSAWLRTMLGLGVVFLMTVKPAPGVALTAFVVSIGLGLVAGLRRRDSTSGALRGSPTAHYSA